MGTLSAIMTFLSDLWALCKDNASAIGLMILNYEEYKIDRERRAKEAVELELQLAKNKEANDANFSGKSDLDVVKQSIVDGGGTAGDIEAADDSPSVPAGPTDPAAGPLAGTEVSATEADQSVPDKTQGGKKD